MRKKKNMLSELQGSSVTDSDSGSSDTVDKSSRVKRYMIGAESFILYSFPRIMGDHSLSPTFCEISETRKTKLLLHGR